MKLDITKLLELLEHLKISPAEPKDESDIVISFMFKDGTTLQAPFKADIVILNSNLFGYLSILCSSYCMLSVVKQPYIGIRVDDILFTEAIPMITYYMHTIQRITKGYRVKDFDTFIADFDAFIADVESFCNMKIYDDLAIEACKKCMLHISLGVKCQDMTLVPRKYLRVPRDNVLIKCHT